MDTAMTLDELISALVPYHTLWLRQATKFQHQQASLELSFLTEEILPFQNCIKYCVSPNKQVSKWSNLRGIMNDGCLVVHAHLPLSGRGDYLRHSILGVASAS